MTGKLLAACLWLCHLTATTPEVRLMTALRRLRLPEALVAILESTLRSLSRLAGDVRQMLLASPLRGSHLSRARLSPRRLALTFSRLASLVGGLFLRTLDRSERCLAARASRDPGGPDPGDPEEPGLSPFEILVEGLTHRYPGAEADSLTGVSLALRRGVRLALLGANGAGKTTLLLYCNGVLPVESGRVMVGGLEVKRQNLAAIRRRVGMVFQNPDDQVFAGTVLQDVRFGPEQAGLPEEECRCRAEEALRLVGLWGQREKPPFSLSQGQRKRAAIAGVIAAGAEVLLFDEPMASLDPAGKDEIQVLLNDLHARGKTIVVATHDVDFAAAWADEVVLMEGGRVVALGDGGLLVDEAAMNVAGLALPLVARPFALLRPHLKRGEPGLERLPANVAEAFAWLRYQLVEKARNPPPQRKPLAAFPPGESLVPRD